MRYTPTASAIAVIDPHAVAPGVPAPLLVKLVVAQLAAAAQWHPIYATGAHGPAIGAKANVEKVVGVVGKGPDACEVLVLLLLFSRDGVRQWLFSGLQVACNRGQEKH